MTQEQIIRRMLEGFVMDPPDSEYQEGFLAAIVVVANEVMGFKWNDELLLKAQASVDPAVLADTATATIAKVRPALSVIDGGKQ